MAVFRIIPECARPGQPVTTYTWSAGSGLTIVSGQGTTTVTVASTSGYVGMTTLQVVATRTGYAASAPVSVPVHIQDGYLSVSGPSGPACFSEDFVYTLNSNQALGNVQWHVYLDGALQDDFIVSANNGELLVWPSNGGEMTVTASIPNQCGGQPLVGSASTTVVEFTRNYAIEPCPMRGGRAATTETTAYPNPADDVLTLPAPSPPHANVARTAVLYNGQGQEVRRKSGKGVIRFATADLTTGLYHLMVVLNGHVTRSQIRVHH